MYCTILLRMQSYLFAPDILYFFYWTGFMMGVRFVCSPLLPHRRPEFLRNRKHKHIYAVAKSTSWCGVSSFIKCCCWISLVTCTPFAGSGQSLVAGSRGMYCSFTLSFWWDKQGFRMRALTSFFIESRFSPVHACFARRLILITFQTCLLRWHWNGNYCNMQPKKTNFLISVD